MDTPSISTLRDESTPPPQKTHIPTLKFRVKPLAAASSAPAASSAKSKKGGASHPLEDEDEEDQLIDDEEDLASTNDPTSHAASTSTTPMKRRASKGKVPRKKRSRAGDKADDASGVATPLGDGAAIITTFDLQAPEISQVNRALPAPGENWETSLSTAGAQSAATSAIRGRKRGTGRKVGGAPRMKKGDSKTSLAAVVSAPQLDETLSEAYSGTAPSSPGPLSVQDYNDVDIETYNSALADSIPPLNLDDIRLDQVAVPVYPLPNRQFSVLPPPKFGSGFAPIIPLDRSGAKVRRWRPVNREVRGIAGGRWFARAWVGEKESELGTFVTPSISSMTAGSVSISAVAAASVALSSVPAPSKSGRKPKVMSFSTDASRSGSLAPDHTVRAPSKMRTSVIAPDLEVSPALG